LRPYYSPGDESAAVIGVDAIPPAWKWHREAMQWLKIAQRVSVIVPQSPAVAEAM